MNNPFFYFPCQSNIVKYISNIIKDKLTLETVETQWKRGNLITVLTKYEDLLLSFIVKTKENQLKGKGEKPLVIIATVATGQPHSTPNHKVQPLNQYFHS